MFILHNFTFNNNWVKMSDLCLGCENTYVRENSQIYECFNCGIRPILKCCRNICRDCKTQCCSNCMAKYHENCREIKNLPAKIMKHYVRKNQKKKEPTQKLISSFFMKKSLSSPCRKENAEKS
jgi:hypothetical protein